MNAPNQTTTRYTIGQLAKTTDIPTSTLRYYERFNLLQPAGRTRTNYRYYDQTAVNRLEFTKAARASGFKLNDIIALLSLRDAHPAPIHEVRKLLTNRITEVDQRLKDLQTVQSTLKSLLKKCHKQEPTGRCAVIDSLDRPLSQ